jgi:hypothetical protein
MKFDQRWFTKAKLFVLELAAFVSLVLILARIIVTEVEQLFGR